MPVAVCNGLELYYERTGRGPRLLYCNGSGSSVHSIRPLLALFASQFDLLVFDYRGMGSSAPVDRPYSMADIAADVADLLNVVDWDQTALLGFSFGGMVAQEFAVTFPDRVSRLGLIATSPGGEFRSYPLETLADLPAPERVARTVKLADRRWTQSWLADHPDQGVLAAAFAAGTSDHETAAQSRGRHLQLRARKDHDVLDRLHLVNCPTFVGSGRWDDIAPVVNGQAIVERIPRAGLHVYDGGHPFLVQDPTAWPHLAAFLAA